MDLAELEQRLTRLEDIDAITRLMGCYCEICDDSHNPDRMVNLFIENGTWEGSGFTATGREDLHALFTTFGTMASTTQHIAVNPTIDIDGDRASATWTNVGLFLLRDTSEWRLMTATYDATCVRVKRKWLYRHVRVDLRLSVALSPGELGARPPEWIHSR
jgi:hypothetical protein